MDLLLGAKQQTHLHKILLLRKRALQMKNFLDRRDHAIPLFIDANVLPLNFLYSQIISNLMHDVHNSQCSQCTSSKINVIANPSNMNTQS